VCFLSLPLSLSPSSPLPSPLPLTSHLISARARTDLLVNFSRESVQNRLVASLYKESLFADLLYEDEGLTAERTRVKSLLQAYKEAFHVSLLLAFPPIVAWLVWVCIQWTDSPCSRARRDGRRLCPRCCSCRLFLVMHLILAISYIACARCPPVESLLAGSGSLSSALKLCFPNYLRGVKYIAVKK
jgi:hypothetical protein